MPTGPDFLLKCQPKCRRAWDVSERNFCFLLRFFRAFMSGEIPVISGGARGGPYLKIPATLKLARRTFKHYSHLTHTETHIFTASSYVTTICVGDLPLNHPGPLWYYNFCTNVWCLSERGRLELLWKQIINLVPFHATIWRCVVGECSGLKAAKNIHLWQTFGGKKWYGLTKKNS